MTGGQARPLLVAGVAGGVGTSTWARILRLWSGQPVQDLREYRGGQVDVLVSSNTAASTSRIGDALRACLRKPLLVIMHTASGEVAESRSHLRKVEPHVTAILRIAHRRDWVEMAEAPGPRLPRKAKDLAEALGKFWPALQAMYAQPARIPAPTTGPAASAQPARTPTPRQSSVIPRAGPSAQQRWVPPPGGQPPHALHRGGQGG